MHWSDSITGAAQRRTVARGRAKVRVLAPEPGDRPQPRKGERAAQIRALYDTYPSMPPSVIARKVGCGQDHVAHVLRRYVKSCSLDELKDFRENKTDILEAVQHRALSSLTDEHFAKASLQQIITSAAILQDKIALMNGMPTAIHLNVLYDAVDAIRAEHDDAA